MIRFGALPVQALIASKTYGANRVVGNLHVRHIRHGLHRADRSDDLAVPLAGVLRRLTDGFPACPDPGISGCSLGSSPVDRIAIIGCGGSGKSHLSRSLGGLLGITPVHLDGLYYDQDWKPLDKEQFAALQRNLVTAPRWIIDGNYVYADRCRRCSSDAAPEVQLDGSVASLRCALTKGRRTRPARQQVRQVLPRPRGGQCRCCGRARRRPSLARSPAGRRRDPRDRRAGTTAPAAATGDGFPAARSASSCCRSTVRPAR